MSMGLILLLMVVLRSSEVVVSVDSSRGVDIQGDVCLPHCLLSLGKRLVIWCFRASGSDSSCIS